jgi:tetratricopeptide (TPR) repeat protein
MKKTNSFSAIIIVLFSFLSSAICAQTQIADSLIKVLNTQKLTPAEQLVLYKNICKNVDEGSVMLAVYAEKGLVLAEKENNNEMALIFNGNLGQVYSEKGNYDKALIYFKKALVLAQDTKNAKAEGMLYMDMATYIYRPQSNYKETLIYYLIE